MPSSEVVKVNVDASSASPSSERFSQYGRAGAALPILSRAASVPGDGFVLSENHELTFPVGETASEGTVSITALDDTLDGPNKTVEVTGTVTDGNGVLPPMPRRLVDLLAVSPDTTRRWRHFGALLWNSAVRS